MLEWQNIEIHQHHTILTFRTFKLLSQILWTLSSVILATARWGKHYQHFNYVCKSWGQDTWPAWHRSEGRVCQRWTAHKEMSGSVGQSLCLLATRMFRSHGLECVCWHYVRCCPLCNYFHFCEDAMWQRNPPEFIPQFIKMVLNTKKKQAEIGRQ